MLSYLALCGGSWESQASLDFLREFSHAVKTSKLQIAQLYQCSVNVGISLTICRHVVQAHCFGDCSHLWMVQTPKVSYCAASLYDVLSPP